MGEVIQMGPQPIPLRVAERMAIQALIKDRTALEQQQAQLNQAAAEHNRADAELCRDIEEAHGLAPNALGTTHAIGQDGTVVIEVQRPAPPAATGTEDE